MRQDLTRESIRMAGPRGELVGELAYAEGPAVAACLLVNPHPHMGGRMGNNLIARLAEDLPQAGVVTLRFDYAGVGESVGADIDIYASMARFWETGRTPEDPLMVEDARAAARWLRGHIDAGVFLAGYSFGCYAAAAIVEPDVAGIVMISPTLNRHDFSALARHRIDKLIVYSDDDFATPASVTRAWIASLSDVRAAHCITGGNHFYLGREEYVADLCREFMTAGQGALK